MIAVDADFIRARRRAAGLSRPGLALRLGVSLHDVEEIERGRSAALGLVVRLAAVLAIDPADLFRDAGTDISRRTAVSDLTAILLEHRDGLTDEDLRRILALSQAEVRASRRVARADLRRAGLTIIVDAQRRNRLVPRSPASLDKRALAASRTRIHLSRDAAAVLYDITMSVYERGWDTTHEPRVRAGLGELIEAGLIISHHGALRPADEVIVGLELRLWQTRAEIARRALE